MIRKISNQNLDNISGGIIDWSNVNVLVSSLHYKDKIMIKLEQAMLEALEVGNLTLAKDCMALIEKMNREFGEWATEMNNELES